MMYFSADSHAFHTNILRYCKDTRPFETVEEMNAALVKGWNSVVTDSGSVLRSHGLSRTYVREQIGEPITCCVRREAETEVASMPFR